MTKNLTKIDKELLDSLLCISKNNFHLSDSLLSDYSLFTGYSGLSLFYSQMYRYTNEIKYLEHAEGFIERAIDIANTDEESGLTFAYGITGLAWLLCYYSENKIFDIGNATYFDELDDVLLSKSLYTPDRPYDPMNGVLGYTNYMFLRNNAKARQSLSYIINFIDLTKEKSSFGITWKSIDFNSYNTGVANNNQDEVLYNIGLAHGVPSIVFFLSKCIKYRICEKKSKELLNYGINWMINVRDNFSDESLICSFPSCVRKNGKLESCVPKWCYSDLSIAILLANVAKLIDDKRLFEFTEKLAIRLAEKVLLNNYHTEDACFCHGASGNAYMFQVLEKYFKDPKITRTKELFKTQIPKLKTTHSILGFSSIQYDHILQKPYMKNDDISLITGSSGIGLALISLLEKKRGKWDSLFLLSY